MPPQPGMFALPYASTHKSRAGNDMHGATTDIGVTYHATTLGSSSRPHAEDNKKDRKRREIAGKLGKEMSDRRDERQLAEMASSQHSIAIQLSTRPQTLPAYNLRLYPVTLERSALLAQLAAEEEYALEGVRTAWEEEREQVENEWKRGRERVRERLLEGIEERRRRAREEKDGEGVVDSALDSQSRPHITRKLRNKLNNSPPPTPFTAGQAPPTHPTTTFIPVPNPNSLSIDELPSPFPLPLTSSLLPNGYTGANGRKKSKGGGVQPQALTGLGKAISQMTSGKEVEIESDMGEIRRGAKRRRAAATTQNNKI
ncbi:hypothetical protein BD410DRAFT_838768 [Rickenella mellea]|uniref:Centrosomal protein ATPase n=1 Tax=Rickenella mellea TaxID=50990 RepID=A0A4Y7Q8Y1_9AGAM|nr:hypothetical protein BD410DRAFT_838768 [Rickenella mellea]